MQHILKSVSALIMFTSVLVTVLAFSAFANSNTTAACHPLLPDNIDGVIVEIGIGISPFAAKQHALEKLSLALKSEITVQNSIKEYSNQHGSSSEVFSESRHVSQVDIDATEIDSGYQCQKYYSIQSVDQRGDIERVLSQLKLLDHSIEVTGATWFTNGRLFQGIQTPVKQMAFRNHPTLATPNSKKYRSMFVKVSQYGLVLMGLEPPIQLQEQNLFKVLNFNPIANSAQPKISIIENNRMKLVTKRLHFLTPEHLEFALPNRNDFTHYSVFNVSQQGKTRWLGTKVSHEPNGKINQWLPKGKSSFQDAYIFIWHGVQNKEQSPAFNHNFLAQLDEHASITNTNLLLSQLSQLPTSQWTSIETILGY